MIADGEHARFVRPADDNTLHNDTTLESFSVHKPSVDLGSGASCHTGASAHHDMHALEKAKFGRAVAAWLNAAADSFDDLVIVAPPHTLVAVRQRLNAATDAKIVGTLAKDLAKTPDADLLPHLRPWIEPNRRAAS
jgi:protein required for attachment to host cells